MDFEGYWKNGCFGEYHDIYAKSLAEQFYQAGQQSKQAEIDALKSKVQELWTEMDDRQSKEYIIEKCEAIIQEILK